MPRVDITCIELGERESETPDGGLGAALFLLPGCLLALVTFLSFFVLLALWAFA